MKRVLVVPRIRVQNANALSSPYTIGFPAMTAWLGAMHALERKLQDRYTQLKFRSMAVVCHEIDLQTHKGRGDYVHSIIATGNPLDKSGKRPSFIEEARCHLNVSLVMECEGLGLAGYDELPSHVECQFRGMMKLAGGDIVDLGTPTLEEISTETDLRKLMGQLMPGHCLIERRDLMLQSMQDGQDALDSLLDHLKVYHHCKSDNEENFTWFSHRKEPGWIVPIATGFHGITDLGEAKSQRDLNTPHRFAESVVTLGQFVMPYRIENLDNMLWHYHTDVEKNLYLCRQNKPYTEN